jgi:Ankyrin repeats (3 copies)/Ankyrin repeat
MMLMACGLNNIMSNNQHLIFPNWENYKKHSIRIIKTYPTISFLILGNELLFKYYIYPDWLRVLSFIVEVTCVFTYNSWRPEQSMEQAVITNNIQELHRLIQHQSWQANVSSFSGYTPLHYACNSSVNNEVVLLLLEYGANPDARSNDKGTPVHWAVSTGNITKLEYLIQYGANLNIQDLKGNTPLHWAVHYKFLPAVIFLIEHGSDRNIANENIKTPLELCRGKSESEEIFSYLNSLDSNQA